MLVDLEEARVLSERFAEVFTTFEPGDDLFTADAIFDLNMPVWRFQVAGPNAFARQLRSISEGPSWIAVLRTEATGCGFVAEHEEYGGADSNDLLARRLWLCDVLDGRISAAAGFCTGDWDAELRARHAAEAPMLRPWHTPPR